MIDTPPTRKSDQSPCERDRLRCIDVRRCPRSAGRWMRGTRRRCRRKCRRRQERCPEESRKACKIQSSARRDSIRGERSKEGGEECRGSPATEGSHWLPDWHRHRRGGCGVKTRRRGLKRAARNSRSKCHRGRRTADGAESGSHDARSHGASEVEFRGGDEGRVSIESTSLKT